MRIQTPVTILDEWAEGPSYAEIDIDAELKARIIKLYDAVKGANATSISEWNYAPEYYSNRDYAESGTLYNAISLNDMEWNGRTECNELVVLASGEFYFTCYDKHTDIKFKTNYISISRMKLTSKL